MITPKPNKSGTSFGELIIERAKTNDVELLSEFAKKTYLEGFAYMYVDEGLLYVEHCFNAEKIRTEIEGNETLWFLAKLAENVVGFLKINPYKSFNGKDALEIERLYLSKNSKGKGFGKRLMEFSIDLAKNKNKEGIWLGVVAANHTAIEFYKRFGFIEEGSYEFQFPTVKDEHRKVMFMYKEISEN